MRFYVVHGLKSTVYVKYKKFTLKQNQVKQIQNRMKYASHTYNYRNMPCGGFQLHNHVSMLHPTKKSPSLFIITRS